MFDETFDKYQSEIRTAALTVASTSAIAMYVLAASWIGPSIIVLALAISIILQRAPMEIVAIFRSVFDRTILSTVVGLLIYAERSFDKYKETGKSLRQANKEFESLKRTQEKIEINHISC